MKSRYVMFSALVVCLAGVGLSAQTPSRPASAGAQAAQPATPAPARPAPAINQTDDPLLRTFRWRSIGPASMGGRVDDIEAVESNPSTYYVGFATGGLWKTTNNGTTFTPIFDTYPVSSIGDIAIAPSNPNIIYVGTGEPNNRQSSSFGAGMYKSTDAGKSFVQIGLGDTQSIARVVVHPRNPDVVYIAAVGHLFGPNEERGLFKTTDGGKTWTKSKFIDADTGFIDLVMDPSNPDTLYAASYQRRRTPSGFNGGGPNSGIWKTTDGGRSWTRLTGNGLPDGGGILGRIGLAIARSNPRIVYAQIEVGPSAGTGGNVTAEGKPAPPSQGGFGGFGGGGAQQQQRPGQPPPPPDPKKAGVWRSDDGGRTWRVVSNNNNRPMYYSQIRVDPTNPQIVYTMGAPFHKSVDGGKTFKVVQGIAHSDHHAMWIDPKNPQHLIIGNDGGIDVSYDQGDTWEFVNTIAVGQFYAISADMQKPYYVCGGLQDNGSWCGPSATRSSNGITNADWYRVGGGDGFYTSNDPTTPTVVYAQSQDGNVTRLDLAAGQTTNIRPRAPQPQRGQRGQGGPATGGREDVTQPQPSTPAGPPVQPPSAGQAQQPSAAAGGQGQQGQPQGQQQAQAFLQRLAQEAGFAPAPTPNIVPTPPVGQQYRFYWNTPTVLSPHNPSMVYIGADRLFISRDRGQTFTMTQDLTRNVDRFKLPIMGVAGDAPMASKHDGAGAFSNIVTISESPVLPGTLWVGTNDGNLQVSRDGGATWKNVVANAKGVPDGTHVSRVETSHFDAGTCYVTFDGHRTDDHKPYVFVTKDFGETFTSISTSLPAGNVNVIREDPKNRNLLYLGTEYAFYVSLDAGKSWKRFMNGLPTVRIDDILVHPRDNDLIVGTHGRSIWIVDDISALQKLGEDAMKDLTVFEPRPATLQVDDIRMRRNMGGAKNFNGQNPERGAVISYYLPTAPSGDVTITISDITGKTVREFKGTNNAGLNRVRWNLSGNPPNLPPNLGEMLENMGMAGAREMLQQAQAQVQAVSAEVQTEATPQFGGGFAAMARRMLEGRPVEPGTYLVKVTAGGKSQTAKLVVEADRLAQ